MVKYLVPAEDLLWLLNAVATTAHPQKIADILAAAELRIEPTDAGPGKSDSGVTPDSPEDAQ
jgi:hypothetical protein